MPDGDHRHQEIPDQDCRRGKGACFFSGPSLAREKSLKCCEHITSTRGEPGNIAYVLHRSTKNPDELVFDEIFVFNKGV
jgi:hypothetical protein